LMRAPAHLLGGLSKALCRNFRECAAILFQGRGRTRKRLPTHYRGIDVSGVDFDSEARSPGHLGRNDRRSRSAEWVIDRLARRRVIFNRPAHALQGLLRAVPVAIVITCVDVPKRGLLPVPAPMRGASHRIPAGFMLPVIMAAAQGKAVLGPNNLGSHI